MNLNIQFDLLKYLLIDFDGTLVDTIPILYTNYQKFLKRYGREGSLEEFVSLMGPSIEEFVPQIKDKYGLPGTDQELIRAYSAGLSARYEEEALLLQGARDFLDYIHSIGIKMALVTSSSYSLIEGSLDNLRLKPYFEHVIAGEKVKKTKPDPEIYFLALKTCGIKSAQALSIEDSYNGLLASLKAGINTIAIQNKHLTRLPEESMSVENWTQLLQIFRQAYAK
jgi:beta-phosphoglucomutase